MGNTEALLVEIVQLGHDAVTQLAHISGGGRCTPDMALYENTGTGTIMVRMGGVNMLVFLILV